ncbi:LytTR family DNA-binding domain-containing protein [Ligilactobacillus animalis]|uniref:LytTR family DNA-binding domain-containing protein n=1 Tax=Ligilactobacillus animalis TaxID=1605 RepID=A0AAJ6FPH3_9LACO|nr:LytTR family DNA-binding domain-containing protein [Ligilactobacillus animalis]WHQ80144.1 LytTR family DNA-binding domain-containing protein [Ligilactobacillus animalis]
MWLVDKQTIQVPKNLHVLEKENPRLWRSHQSYLLNPGNVYMLDKLNATATFVNGLKCPVSRQKFKILAECFA